MSTHTLLHMMPYEDKGRDWGNAATNQGTPKIVSRPLKAREEAWDRFFFTALRRNQC